MKEIKKISEQECEVYSDVTENYKLDDNPIVTVSVITYNSSDHILETLDSIKTQTYRNLILQISDDKSTDSTVSICRNWIQNNQNRFVKTKVIVPLYNTGVSANCNRCWEECETKWYKDIAGDDILLPDCIESYMYYVNLNPSAVIVFGKSICFSSFKGIRLIQGYRHDYDLLKLDTSDLHEKLLWEGNRLPASSVFYNIETLNTLGIRHDTRIRNIEDYPKWLKLSKLGIKFHFIDKDTVLYRREEKSLSIGLFSPNYYYQEVLLCLYCYLDEIKQTSDKDKIYNLIAEHCTHFYKTPYYRATTSLEYKIGSALLSPIKLAKKIIKNFINRIK